MTLIRMIFTLALLTTLAGCAGWGARGEVDKLNRAEPVGSPYTRAMAAEYRSLANWIQNNSFFSKADARHFARKGLAAASGLVVMPETISDWNMTDAGVAETTKARTELVALLDSGARDMFPNKAAAAQSRFDCWTVEEEVAPAGAEKTCQQQFRAALESLKTAMGTIPPVTDAVLPPASASSAQDGATSGGEEFPAPVTGASRGGNVPVQQATFLVFFDWDKYNITDSARSVLDTVAQELKGRTDVKRIVIVGHADTSGSEKYNRKLSVKRADAAREALASRGFPKEKMETEGRGESDLLVQTPDNVRQPENRRAQITLE